jgi:CheY-like chemotaxis protein
VTTSLPRILVVQDEPSNLHIASVFCAAGYEVTAVVGAAKAISVLESRGPFALYVIDLPIPSERSTIVAAAIRQSQPEARILYFAPFCDALFTLHGRLLPGREELLEKPSPNSRCLRAASRMLFGHDKGPRART